MTSLSPLWQLLVAPTMRTLPVVSDTQALYTVAFALVAAAAGEAANKSPAVVTSAASASRRNDAFIRLPPRLH
ncbi:MAG TPA: hypothetical protein VII83_00935 [Gaiellaceae bacterium]